MTTRIDEILDELLVSTGALAVWLLGTATIVDNQLQNPVLAGAVQDPSITPPAKVFVANDFVANDFFGEPSDDRSLFAQPIGRAIVVVIFDDRSSLGLVRLRIRRSTGAIEAALARLPRGGPARA